MITQTDQERDLEVLDRVFREINVAIRHAEREISRAKRNPVVLEELVASIEFMIEARKRIENAIAVIE
jgi:hypothetical protein